MPESKSGYQPIPRLAHSQFFVLHYLHCAGPDADTEVGTRAGDIRHAMQLREWKLTQFGTLVLLDRMASKGLLRGFLLTREHGLRGVISKEKRYALTPVGRTAHKAVLNFYQSLTMLG